MVKLNVHVTIGFRQFIFNVCANVGHALIVEFFRKTLPFLHETSFHSLYSIKHTDKMGTRIVNVHESKMLRKLSIMADPHDIDRARTRHFFSPSHKLLFEFLGKSATKRPKLKITLHLGPPARREKSPNNKGNGKCG
jgi:hypothetical protein